MFDQSFSVKNFRKIFDIENRRGNYLEKKFLPSVLEISKNLQRKRNEYRSLKKKKGDYEKEQYSKLREVLGSEIEELKKLREKELTDELEKVSSEALEDNFVIDIRELDIGTDADTDKKMFVTDDKASIFLS